MNARDSTCTLRDCMYKDVQKDWPGYSEGDQQLLQRVLVRYRTWPRARLAGSGRRGGPSPTTAG